MKKILLTAVGYNDPYTNNGKYNDGSLLHIIRNYHTDGNPIEEIYAYFSFDMAIEESKTHALEIAVSEIEGKHKIKINYFPRGIIEEVSKKREEIRKNLLANNYQGNDLDKEVETELNKITDIGRIDVNKFGSFYPEIQVMLSDIEKKPNIKDYEILVNVTSGTPAMKEDLNLMSITNKNSNLKLKMIQVAIPGISKSERRSYPYTNNLSLEEIKEDISKVNIEEKNNNRTSEEKMTNIKKLLLLESIEHLFAKYDYAGVYEATSNAYKENYLENVQINLYAKNLYYRYIGNTEVALAASNNLSFKRIELYPIKDEKVDDHFKNINTNYGLLLENYNILQVKAKRLEINDWLLLAQTIIEDLYKKVLYKITNGFDIDNIIVDNINPSIDKFDELYSDYDYLKPIIFIKDKRNFGAGALKVILSKTLKLNLISHEEQKELINTINVLDMIRTYRNTSAHTIGFVTKEILKDGINEKIEDLKNNKHIYITLKNPRDIVEEAHYHIKKLIDYCIDDENRGKLEDAYNLYQNIKEQIITLLKAEITERGE